MASVVNKGEKRKKEGLDQFVLLSDDDLNKRIKMGKNINTEKSEKKAHKSFTNFLVQLGCADLDYWLFEEPELDRYLAKFWLGLRKSEEEDMSEDETSDGNKKKQLYSANSLRCFRYALNRLLKAKGHGYDITIKGTSFLRSDEAFKVALKELKEEGKAEVQSYPEINEQGNIQFLDLDLRVNRFCQ